MRAPALACCCCCRSATRFYGVRKHLQLHFISSMRPHYIFRTLIKHRLREFAGERAWEGFIDAAGAAVCFQLTLKSKRKAGWLTRNRKRLNGNAWFVHNTLESLFVETIPVVKDQTVVKVGHTSQRTRYPLVLYSLVIFHCIFVRAKCRFFWAVEP